MEGVLGLGILLLVVIFIPPIFSLLIVAVYIISIISLVLLIITCVQGEISFGVICGLVVSIILIIFTHSHSWTIINILITR